MFVASSSDGAADDALGRAVRLMGHDLRNKLGVMRNSAYYLNMKVGRQSEKLARHVGILLEQIDLGNWLVGNLMDLVAPKRPSPVETDLNALIARVLGKSPARGRAEVTPVLACDLPLVRVDAEQIGRAIENLVLCQWARLGDGEGLRVVSRADGAGVCVDLVASGPALSPEEQERLFDLEGADGPSALGVGLVVARRLAELNGATLRVESRSGLGTRFSIIMPAT